MNWDQAKEWEDKANTDKEIDQIEPRWSFDCGFKLDYDGGLLRVSSRFYQIGKDIYDGSVSFYIGDDQIFNREFSSRHINILNNEVEKYVLAVTENFKEHCRRNMAVFIMEGKQ